MIKRWDGQHGGLFVRNPHFRVRSPDRPDGFPNEILFQGMPSDQVVATVDRGTFDVGIFSYGTEPPVKARARFGARFHVDGFPQTWFAFMNTRVPPFNDARVRRALNYAVDRGRVAELIGAQATNTPTCQLLPPGFLGHTPSCPFSVASSAAGVWIGPDMAKARRLVAQSGTRGMKVEFWGSQPWPRAADYFASLLRRLGYRARARTVGDLFEIMQARPRPQIGLWGWIADSAGPLNFLSPLISCGAPENGSNFCDRKIDAAMKDAAAAHGPDATEKWRRVDAALAAASPTIPLVNENLVRLTAKRVGNYQSHPVWGPLLDQMWVK
jgi:peptide/nickel transport system substrate-binding protein